MSEVTIEATATSFQIDTAAISAGWMSDNQIVGDLRTDHAGETGAVYIYRGILAVSRDANVIAFARDHLATESQHLKLIEEILPRDKRSRLIPVWKLAGWMTGFLPALFGPRVVFKTIEAVETFVDQHYQEQIDYLNEINLHADLKNLLEICQADEQHHRDEAGAFAEAGATPGTAKAPLITLWTKLVGWGSQSAVAAARYI
ncbi:MAG: demethoxyubiquinone hydroxylase family protein [Pseudomonadota bacterium]